MRTASLNSVQIRVFWMPGLILVLLGISLTDYHLFFEIVLEFNRKLQKGKQTKTNTLQHFYFPFKEPQNINHKTKVQWSIK